jgi:hypothetical protein
MKGHIGRLKQLETSMVRIMDLITYTNSPHPNPFPRKREQNPIPLLPGEKGLGDEGVQGAWFLNNSLIYLIHDPKSKTEPDR